MQMDEPKIKHILSGDVQRHQRGRGRRGGRAARPDAEDDGGAGTEADCPARAGRSVTTFTLKPLSSVVFVGKYDFPSKIIIILSLDGP